MIVDLSVNSQAVSFLLFCGVGTVSGMIFDLYRAFLNLHFKNKYPLSGDIAVSAIISVFVFISFMKISSLRLSRCYFFAAGAGGLIYFLALSPHFFRFFMAFLKIFEKILKILLSPGKFSCIIMFRMCFCLCKILLIPVKAIGKFAAKQYEALKHFAVRLKKI